VRWQIWQRVTGRSVTVTVTVKRREGDLLTLPVAASRAAKSVVVLCHA
jgi:hypothetical protein